jgi:2,4-dienoyl-CoA reductase-like NADH-dependent reductase (Old Yellow Enzyme family)
MRFVVEVVRRIRSLVAPSFAVGIKLNSADFQRGGFTEEESRDVVAQLATEGLDLIEVSGGSYEAPAMMGSAAKSTRDREAYFLEYARAVRDVAGKVPLAVTGGNRTRTAMEAALTSGDCDVIGIGRPSCTTPDAGSVILDTADSSIESHRVAYNHKGLVGKVIDLKAINGAVELAWHEDQLHRIGKGKEPDLKRGKVRATAALLARSRRGAFAKKRS